MSVKLERLEHDFIWAISRILSEEVKDETINFVTINDVKITNDLSFAKVYITTLNDENKDQVMEALNRAGSFIRAKLCDLVEIRKMPKLIFVYDESLAYGQKIEQILETINDNNE